MIAGYHDRGKGLWLRFDASVLPVRHADEPGPRAQIGDVEQMSLS